MGEPRDELDEALDNALASYGQAPDIDGLERRILLRVAEQAQRTPPIRSLTVGIGAALAVAAAYVFWWMPPKVGIQNLPVSPTVMTSRNIEAPPLRRTPISGRAGANKPRRIRIKSAEPKLAKLPTPSPLTSEERALIRLVALNVKDMPRAWTSFGRPIKPIYIAAVEIQPLQLAWNSKEKKCCD